MTYVQGHPDNKPGPHTANIEWSYPRIGTCGEPMDGIRINLSRTRAVNDLIVRFDGEKDAWILYGSFPTQDGDDFEERPVGIIPEWDDSKPYDKNDHLGMLGQ